LPSSPRLVPAWDFRDDTGVQSHVPETSALVPEKRGKMRKISTATDRDDSEVACSSQEKKQRKKWSMEETQMLVNGCNLVSIYIHTTLAHSPISSSFALLARSR
jgi:hypothetical protein